MKRRPKQYSLDPGAPYTFPRRVLLAVTGLSPQVVTETLYALTQKVKPPFVPTEIHLLTTAEGAESAKLTLLSPEPGWFHRFCRDYHLSDIEFGERTIHPLKAADGTAITDIRTGQENERLADALTARIREFTADPKTALHVSIAGGRKTMGFYAGYALSLLARPQDRLSHVLVGADYESNRSFYYPTPYPHVIDSEKRPLDSSKAEVTLADIAFVRMRNELDGRLLHGSVTFSEAVAAAQRALDPPSLEIDTDRKCIHAGGQEIHLQPAQLAFVSWLARRAKNRQSDVECPRKKTTLVPKPENPEYATEYLREYAHVADDNSLTADRLRRGMDKSFFEQNRTKLHQALRKSLGTELARRYEIGGDGARPRQHYRLMVPAENIRWLDQTDSTEVGKLAKTSAVGAKGL